MGVKDKAKSVGELVGARVMVAAQVHQPVMVGSIIRKVTSSGSKKKKKGAVQQRTSGVAAANAAAGVPAERPRRDPNRTSGILAANVAAGIPGAK